LRIPRGAPLRFRVRNRSRRCQPRILRAQLLRQRGEIGRGLRGRIDHLDGRAERRGLAQPRVAADHGVEQRVAEARLQRDQDLLLELHAPVEQRRHDAQAERVLLLPLHFVQDLLRLDRALQRERAGLDHEDRGGRGAQGAQRQHAVDARRTVEDRDVEHVGVGGESAREHALGVDRARRRVLEVGEPRARGQEPDAPGRRDDHVVDARAPLEHVDERAPVADAAAQGHRRVRLRIEIDEQDAQAAQRE